MTDSTKKSVKNPFESRFNLGLTRLNSYYCITRIFRVEERFAIFANLDFARNFSPANKYPLRMEFREILLSRIFPPCENKITNSQA